jgi:hypothetical protein
VEGGKIAQFMDLMIPKMKNPSSLLKGRLALALSGSPLGRPLLKVQNKGAEHGGRAFTGILKIHPEEDCFIHVVM